ncbi:radical SAM family protein [Novosphingobium sp. PhB165]|uniref:radical SAM/SPASM domain-containing protein n=1 Tax=Novosphingobium sp. PhB165 TaxID=2485105 RepID=UPI00104CD19C|nr:radical SAM protein [Novosphingobium sp. PhB165]TCM16462.1 radical SAM family protein [Novosphingobium sp. PhB165]
MFESIIHPEARPIAPVDVVEQAQRLIERDGLTGIGDALAPLEGVTQEQMPGINSVLALSVRLLIEAFRTDARAPAVYDALLAIPPQLAGLMFDLMLECTFGSGPRDVSVLNEESLLALVGLLSCAGAHEQAALLLADARKQRTGPGLNHSAWVARCRWASCASSIGDYLADAAIAFADAEAARAEIDVSPINLAAHRAGIRFALAAGDLAKTRSLAGAALALPVGDEDKMELAADLALLVAVQAACGDEASLQADQMRWAFAAAPKVTSAAAAILEAQMAGGNFPFLDTAEAESAAAMLRSFVAPGANPAVTGYPMRGGKPHVDTVWLEITNHCNQKCTFCPDMFREDARSWLPLQQVKDLIDQLADTLSVGSMQLNAYGEPLLHPNISEILAYIRERKLPFPTFFTSHGMTLVEKKLKQLSGNYPAGIAISLHNDSQESYEATRSHKIGDYETLVTRVSGLLRQMAYEQAPSHLRLYQMVSNGAVDLRVDEVTRSAFPETPERMLKHVRKWEAIAADIAAAAPPEAQVIALSSSQEDIYRAFLKASHGDHDHMPILSWVDVNGGRQSAFMSARPVGTYANLLLEYDPRWAVDRKLVTGRSCGFTKVPSLAIFATGRLGICCLDLNSTATFGSLSDFDNLHDALTSQQALRMFAQLSNGIATSRGCQICLGGTERHCASKQMSGPERPAGHFRDGI